MPLRRIHGLHACGRLANVHRSNEDRVGGVHLGLDLNPVLPGVLGRPPLRLLPRLGLAPALLGLVGVLLAEAVSEQLFLLSLGQLHARHLLLQRLVDGRNEITHLIKAGQDRGTLATQVLDHGRAVGRHLLLQQGGDLFQ